MELICFFPIPFSCFYLFFQIVRVHGQARTGHGARLENQIKSIFLPQQNSQKHQLPDLYGVFNGVIFILNNLVFHKSLEFSFLFFSLFFHFCSNVQFNSIFICIWSGISPAFHNNSNPNLDAQILFQFALCPIHPRTSNAPCPWKARTH